MQIFERSRLNINEEKEASNIAMSVHMFSENEQKLALFPLFYTVFIYLFVFNVDLQLNLKKKVSRVLVASKTKIKFTFMLKIQINVSMQIV